MPGAIDRSDDGVQPDVLLATFGVAVAPHLRRQYAPMAGVDRVTDGLADQMRPERPATEPVTFEQLAGPASVVVLGERAIDLEVIASAGQLEPVEALLAAQASERVDRNVTPLAGEQRDRSP